MKTNRKITGALVILFFLALFSPGYTQTIDKAKLDLLFDHILEKNKGMGSITIAKDGEILYTRLADIVSGVFDIYWDRPYQVPTFEALEVNLELLDQYVGVYVRDNTNVKMTVVRSGSTIAIENGGKSIPLEATEPDTFTIAPGVTVSFNTEKKQMTIKRPQGEGVFTKEN